MLLESVFALTLMTARTASSFIFVAKRSPTSSSGSLSSLPGAGGMFDTRNPNSFEDDDPRKSISAAPSFEEYMKMREGGTTTSAPLPPPSEQQHQQQQQQPAAGLVAGAEEGGGNDAVKLFEASQAAIVDEIASKIPDLIAKPDFTWTAPIDGFSTKVDARDAVGKSNVAWLSSVCVDTKMSSLTIFNGPLTDVPHLVSRVCCVGDHLQFKLDFRPRCYGAYEMIKEDGTYPGPEELGRKSFEYSGNRKEFESKFGNDEMQEFLSSTISSFQSANEHDPDKNELDVLTRGPLYTSLTFPNTKANVAAVIAAREKAVSLLLSWMKDDQHEHRPGAPVNSQYVYDTKFKLNAYCALLDEYSKMYGPDDGKKLAVGESGPLDEAYVGGGS